jgi:arylformamidase
MDMNKNIAAAASAIDSELESHYNLRARHPERGEIYHGFAQRSAATRRSASAHLDLRYGPEPSSTMDVFVPQAESPVPLLVFIHGGYWRALDKNNFSFVADAYLDAGVAVAMPNYALVPHATVGAIVDQVCASMDWLLGQAARLGFDPDRVLISGHSAGGHMAAIMACPQRAPALRGRLLGCVCLSGLFDLQPLLRTSVNTDLNMTPAEALALNVYAAELADVPLLLAAGELETAGFRSQSEEFARYLAARGRAAQSIIVPGRNHFDLVGEFADPGSALFAKTLALLRGVRQ